MKLNKLSNEGLKSLFNLADSLKSAIQAANADGKINLAALPALLGVLFVLPQAIQSVRTVWPELQDLNAEEVEELKERIRAFSKDEAVVSLVGYLLLALSSAFAISKK
mgnify:FL=1